MNQEYKLYRISQLLSRFKEQVEILNTNGEFSINVHAENMLIKILNEVYDCDLENVNYTESKTYPSIDLRDKKKRLAIQVTSTNDFKKVKSTLSKLLDNNIYKDYSELYIFIITHKLKNYDQDKIDEILDGKFLFSNKNILDRTDIYKELNKKNDLKKIETVEKLLEMQFSDKEHFSKWDRYCKDLKDYDIYISNLYKYLDIKGFSPKINNTLVKITLDKIFIPLELKLNKDTIDETGDEHKRTTYLPEEALAKFDKLVILGDPGSGKSTILKHIAYRICTQRQKDGLFSDYLPIFIKGSENRSLHTSLEKFK